MAQQHTDNVEDIIDFSKGKTSAVDRVVNYITEGIIGGRFRPGDRIPTETEISEACSIGRNSVREAIKQLQAFGILYIKRADGTYVTNNYNSRLLDPALYNLILREHVWREFVELRAVLDIGTLHLAIRRDDIDNLVPRLNEIIEMMAREIYAAEPDVNEVLKYDLKFHKTIEDTMNNPLIDTVAEYVTRIGAMSRLMTVEKWIRENKRDVFISLHRQIVDVIEQKDAERIEKVVQDHYIYWREE